MSMVYWDIFFASMERWSNEPNCNKASVSINKFTFESNEDLVWKMAKIGEHINVLSSILQDVSSVK